MSFICHNKPTSMYFMCPKGFFDLSSYKREKGWPKCTPDPWTHCSTCGRLQGALHQDGGSRPRGGGLSEGEPEVNGGLAKVHGERHLEAEVGRRLTVVARRAEPRVERVVTGRLGVQRCQHPEDFSRLFTIF